MSTLAKELGQKRHQKYIDLILGYMHKVNEETVKNNFVVIYELLDEVLDYGYPQQVELQALKGIVTQQGLKQTLARQVKIKLLIF